MSDRNEREREGERRRRSRSPRRRSRSASPSEGTQERRRRRKSGWDTEVAADGSVPAAPAAPFPMPGFPLPGAQAPMDPTAVLAKAQAAFLHRIYAGSLNYDVTEEDLQTVFGHFGPIKSLTLVQDPATGRHKGYAFIEYFSAEPANTALQCMTGYQLKGRPIKVGRPNNASAQQAAATVAIAAGLPPTALVPQFAAPSGYSASGSLPGGTSPTYLSSPPVSSAPSAGANSALQALLQQAQARQQSGVQINPAAVMAASAASGQPGPGCRVYVGSIIWTATENDIRVIFQPYGPIRRCALQMDPSTGRHKGYGFVDYMSPESAREAIANLNGFELGGRQLKVSEATHSGGGSSAPSMPAMPMMMPGMPGMPGMPPGFPFSMPPQIQGSSSISSEENPTLRGAADRALLMQKLARGPSYKSSRVVVLKNMVGPEEVDEELKNEVQDECSKYGSVQKVVIVTEGPNVKIFVLFLNMGEASQAVSGLDKRWFGGRTIMAEFFPEEKFLAQDFSE